MDYTLHLHRPSEQVIPELVAILEGHGLRVMVTFDLQLARGHQAGCHCPHHGTQRCTCQYAVLLAYDREGERHTYGTITAHGRDGEVWLSLLKSPPPSGTAAEQSEVLGKRLLDLIMSLSRTTDAEGVWAEGPAVSEV
jgi:hypothetical protein